jgi:hypothetical protein
MALADVLKEIKTQLQKQAEEPSDKKAEKAADKQPEKAEKEPEQNLRFSVAEGAVTGETKLTLKVSGLPVKRVLDRLADLGDFGWYVESNAGNVEKDGQIVIRKSPEGIERGYEIGLGRALAELEIRHPRPVYPLLSANIGQSKVAIFDESDVVLMTPEDTWNESMPFVNEKREVPRFQEPKDDDPKKGTLEEERRGPFPIAIAVERTLPKSWYDDKNATPAKTRIAVLGNGGIFVGNTISPVKEKLLLDTTNWLLGRDDLLAHSANVWSYPRVELTREQEALWFLGMQVGLPLLFAYIGVLVWFVRRMR